MSEFMRLDAKAPATLGVVEAGKIHAGFKAEDP